MEKRIIACNLTSFIYEKIQAMLKIQFSHDMVLKIYFISLCLWWSLFTIPYGNISLAHLILVLHEIINALELMLIFGKVNT